MKVIDGDISYGLIHDDTPVFCGTANVDSFETAGLCCGAVLYVGGDEGDLVGGKCETAHGTLVDLGARLVGAKELAGEDDVPGEIGVFRLGWCQRQAHV